jgi:chromosome segregation ATPase
MMSDVDEIGRLEQKIYELEDEVKHLEDLVNDKDLQLDLAYERENDLENQRDELKGEVYEMEEVLGWIEEVYPHILKEFEAVQDIGR